MGKKILIVGGVAGGGSCAARIRRLDEDAKIIVFEKSRYVSYSNCSLPFYLGDVVKDEGDLIMVSPEMFKDRFHIDTRTQHEVIAICRSDHTVLVRDLKNGKEYKEKYDKLVLSPGAIPLRPGSIPGAERKNVFTIRNVEDASALKSYLKQNGMKNVVVVGGGFIGVEAAENLVRAGYCVSVIEALPQILTTFDEDMVQILHRELWDHGVKLHLNEKVQEIMENCVVLESGKEIPADAVVLAMGVRPDVQLAVEAGIEIGESGGVAVDHNYCTNDPDIYAVGDAVEVYHKILHKPTRLTLAGPAQRQARTAANHICGILDKYSGIIGSSVLKVFRLNAACTGLNERNCKQAGISYGFSYVIPNDKVSIMPDSHPLYFKLIYEVPTGKILGAQAIGEGAADKRIDVIAAMVAKEAYLEDLKELELCYSPFYGTAKDVVNQAALVGMNLLYGSFRQIPVTQARKLVESGAFIVDVREKKEYEKGHLISAINIPLSEIRSRLDEIPKDKPVYLHCRSGQRSYNAVMALQNMGWKNVYNISGSFLGICLYEFYHDVSENRSRIVTEYNFN